MPTNVVSYLRKFLFDILSSTLEELKVSQSFTGLVAAVNQEKNKKTELQNIIIK